MKISPHNYGYFSLGLNKTSAPFQNLQLALKLNEQLVSLEVDDMNLQSLYLIHLLLGNTAKADQVKARFDNFATGENYNLIARAYHRMNDKVKADYYAKLAGEAGYVRTAWDTDFFSLSF